MDCLSNKRSLLSAFGKAAAACLAAVLISSAGGLRTEALGRTPPGMVVTGSGRVSGNYFAMIDYICEGMLEHRENIDVRGFGYVYNESEYMDLIEEIRAAAPEAFYVRGFGCSIDSSDRILKIVPTYITDAETSQRMLAEFDSAANYYLGLVRKAFPSDGDDLARALYLHDLLIDDFTYYIPPDDKQNLGAYEVLVNKRGSCYCYSRAYAYLLGQLGIPSEIVQSEKMYHEWIKIKVGGGWYHVDLTWDDTDSSKKSKYTFFLLGDDRIRLNLAGGAHTDFGCINPSDGRYDLKGFHDFTSPVCFAEGEMYTVKDNALIGYDLDRNSTWTAVDLSDLRWSTGVGSSCWIGCFSTACSYRGRVFYNSADGVFMYDPEDGSVREVFTRRNGSAYYGVKALGSKLYAVCRADPDAAPSTVELGTLFTVDFNTGTDESIRTQVLTAADLPQQPADPEREGYEFTGWQLKGSNYDFSSPIRKDVILTAGWRKLPPPVTEQQLAEMSVSTVTLSRAMRLALDSPIRI